MLNRLIEKFFHENLLCGLSWMQSLPFYNTGDVTMDGVVEVREKSRLGCVFSPCTLAWDGIAASMI